MNDNVEYIINGIDSHLVRIGTVYSECIVSEEELLELVPDEEYQEWADAISEREREMRILCRRWEILRDSFAEYGAADEETKEALKDKIRSLKDDVIQTQSDYVYRWNMLNLAMSMRLEDDDGYVALDMLRNMRE